MCWVDEWYEATWKHTKTDSIYLTNFIRISTHDFTWAGSVVLFIFKEVCVVGGPFMRRGSFPAGVLSGMVLQLSHRPLFVFGLLSYAASL